MAASAGGRLSEVQRRRVVEHARGCDDCRRVVAGRDGAHAVGLGLALPLAAAPQLLGSQLAASTASSGVASPAAATVSAGAGSVATLGAVGGLAAKIAGLGVGKAAVVALAATSIAAGGIEAAYDSSGARGTQRPPGRPV